MEDKEEMVVQPSAVDEVSDEAVVEEQNDDDPEEEAEVEVAIEKETEEKEEEELEQERSTTETQTVEVKEVPEESWRDMISRGKLHRRTSQHVILLGTLSGLLWLSRTSNRTRR